MAPATPATPATPASGQSRQNALGQWSTEYFIAGATFEILDDYILEERVGQGCGEQPARPSGAAS